MKDWTEDEIDFMLFMLDEALDKIAHYPDDFSEDEDAAYSSLRRRLYAEAKNRGHWWAK